LEKGVEKPFFQWNTLLALVENGFELPDQVLGDLISF
jgi:hypothetical protein